MIIDISVEYIDDGRDLGSGYPAAKGWWFIVVANGHRVSGVTKSEEAAWATAHKEIAGPWGQSFFGIKNPEQTS